MYKALVDLDSLTDEKFLANYEVSETYDEFWPGEEPDILHISKIKIEDSQYELFIRMLSEQFLKDEWFALAWNEDSAYIIFKRKIFKMKNTTPWDEKEFLELIEYGKTQNIDPKYFNNMRRVMNSW
jgi:hypothetical protein